MDWIQLFICITGLTGHILIARRDRRGYWFWIFGNSAIIKLSLADGHYGMAGLFLAYTFISLKALQSWGKKQEDLNLGSSSKKPPFERLKSLFDSFKEGRENSDLAFVVYIQVRT
jgi:hypothetical protein